MPRGESADAPERREAPFETPVAFFIFNRPQQTRRVFAEIARARPRTLLIVADGPRADRPEDPALCAAARAAVEEVTWDCRVLRCYSEANLGCRARVSSGLDWVFSQCEEAIVLEDDCLPDPSFFPFCAELLERYRDDERVMMISGNNFQPEWDRSPYSYYGSAYAHIWGWASWRRAWQHYDVEMRLWPLLRARAGLLEDLGERVCELYWCDIFDRTHAGAIDTWDYQWLFACRAQSGLTLIPERNLVTNIGFGAGATHTAEENHLANLPRGAIELPLRHPPYLLRDTAADRVTFGTVFLPLPVRRTLASRVRSRAAALVRRVLGGRRAAEPAVAPPRNTGAYV
jgi:hypothetical protein